MFELSAISITHIWVLLSLAQLISCVIESPHPCFSDIYCHGRLLHTVQMAKIYKDSKTFVDMKLKAPPNDTLINFTDFMKKHNDTPSSSDIKDFVHDNFEPEGQEFENWEPKDWVEDPKFLANITDENFKSWATSLNFIWKSLGRQMKDDVKINQELYSIIWIPNPVIVPGGRFREFYYWDSYWIIQGLLLSEMYSTAKGMLENFIYIVEKYGHVPNGGRIYYLERSQPPLLIPMLKLYLDATNDTDFIVKNIEALESEFTYWMAKHTTEIEVDGKPYRLAVYGDRSQGPRPESYCEDFDSAMVFKDHEKKEAYYSELKAAAESGWDFSSRWFIYNATNKGNLTHTKTRSIAPVDLNSIMYWNAVLLAEFYGIKGDDQKVNEYEEIAQNWLEAVNAVLWHEEVGAWLDYDLQNNIKRDYFYPTNIAPLWTGCYDKNNKHRIVTLVLKYLQNKQLRSYKGGVPTTVEHTGEQWDFPNAWPPLQYIMIVGLNNTHDARAQKLANDMAENWLRSNYKAYNETFAMYEKYDATILGGHGGGGEYEVQLGFGWTNGIVMYLLAEYGHMFKSHEDTTEKEYTNAPQMSSELHSNVAGSATFVQITTTVVGLIVTLAVGYIGCKNWVKRRCNYIRRHLICQNYTATKTVILYRSRSYKPNRKTYFYVHLNLIHKKNKWIRLHGFYYFYHQKARNLPLSDRFVIYAFVFPRFFLENRQHSLVVKTLDCVADWNPRMLGGRTQSSRNWAPSALCARKNEVAVQCVVFTTSPGTGTVLHSRLSLVVIADLVLL